MHIDNTYLTPRTVNQSEDVSATSESPRRPGPGSPAIAETSQHVRSPELLELLARVKHAPEVRQEVLQRAAERLATGYYLSNEAAEQTAQTILDRESGASS